MYKLQHQPQTVGEALVLAEAHLRVIGMSEFSPIAFAKNAVRGEVTASIFPTTKLRIQEVLPGLRLRAGNSIIDVVKVIPTNKEVIYKTNRGGQFRMPTEKFVQLAIQQGFKKIWDVKNFLIALKNLLKPVLESVPLMLVLKWVLSYIRGRKPIPSDRGPDETGDYLERGRLPAKHKSYD